MNRYKVNKKALVMSLIAASFVISPVFAFDSGSTDADGAFSPTVNTTLQLPPSGIFNFTTVNIPSGVTVTFTKNTTNTPVVILASGNVTIAGSINLNATSAISTGTSGDGNLGDDGIPGTGGPGGYDGGAGGTPTNKRGGDGLGPGGGLGTSSNVNGNNNGGGGAGHTNAGGNSSGATGGPAYGSTLLLPLVGGSGGGGGTGGSFFSAAGGGGGGGAILIASSGTVSITGSILANGGGGGNTGGSGCGGAGGGGSGGAIRIAATTISGNGTINAVAGGGGPNNCGTYSGGGGGSTGRIRLEAEIMQRTATSNPGHSFSSAPGPVFVSGLPTLSITRVAGVDAPAQPTGNADITLPVSTPNPVTVEFATTGVPVGNTVTLKVKPVNGVAVTVVSPALTGTTTNATASVDVNLPGGPNVLQATVSYTVVASVGDALGVQFAKGERVEKIELAAGMNGSSTTTLITVSGKRYSVPALVPAMGKAG